jgi:hypothetical protein
MHCCHHYYQPVDGGLNALTVSMPRLTFGRGVLREVGARVRNRQLRRVALVTDAKLADSVHLQEVRQSLSAAGVEFAEYAEISVEPTDRSVMALCEFLNDAHIDAVVSVGGGSVIDTSKSALVYMQYPASVTTYFGAPPRIGDDLFWCAGWGWRCDPRTAVTALCLPDNLWHRFGDDRPVGSSTDSPGYQVCDGERAHDAGRGHR